MRNSTTRNFTRVAAAVIAVLVSAGSVHAGNRDAADIEKKLQAMTNADTDWHPDLAGEFNGMRYYMHGKYESAMEQFKHGAYYADKLSQLCVGLMYLNGQGVAKDAVAAYAWLDLAAERSYPEFTATRDRVKATLTAEQLQQATEMRAELDSVYADAVAKRRLATQLALGQMRLTGSRTGYDFSVMSLPADIYSAPGGGWHCGIGRSLRWPYHYGRVRGGADLGLWRLRALCACVLGSGQVFCGARRLVECQGHRRRGARPD